MFERISAHAYATFANIMSYFCFRCSYIHKISHIWHFDMTRPSDVDSNRRICCSAARYDDVINARLAFQSIVISANCCYNQTFCNYCRVLFACLPQSRLFCYIKFPYFAWLRPGLRQLSTTFWLSSVVNYQWVSHWLPVEKLIGALASIFAFFTCLNVFLLLILLLHASNFLIKSPIQLDIFKCNICYR